MLALEVADLAEFGIDLATLGFEAAELDALLHSGAADPREESTRVADAALNTLWRNQEDGRGVLLFVTHDGLEAIGVDSAHPGGRHGPDGGQRVLGGRDST